MNLIVTGAFGFLGSAILNKLVDNDEHKIYAFVKSTSLTDRISKKNLQKTTIVHVDKMPLDAFFKENKIDGIIHTSTDYGRNSSISSIINTNVTFPIDMIEIGNKYDLKFFINYDSYFNKINTNYNYLGNYILTKKHLEDWLKKIDAINIFNLKLEHLYGANDSETKFVSIVLKDLFLDKEEINLTEGNQERDFIYIDDVVALTCEIIEKHELIELKYHDIEVGTGKSNSIKSFVLQLKNELKNELTHLNFGALPTRENEIMCSKADLSKLPKQIQWIPKVDLKEGIKKIIFSLK